MGYGRLPASTPENAVCSPVGSIHAITEHVTSTNEASAAHERDQCILRGSRRRVGSLSRGGVSKRHEPPPQDREKDLPEARGHRYGSTMTCPTIPSSS